MFWHSVMTVVRITSGITPPHVHTHKKQQIFEWSVSAGLAPHMAPSCNEIMFLQASSLYFRHKHHMLSTVLDHIPLPASHKIQTQTPVKTCVMQFLDTNTTWQNYTTEQLVEYQVGVTRVSSRAADDKHNNRQSQWVMPEICTSILQLQSQSPVLGLNIRLSFSCKRESAIAAVISSYCPAKKELPQQLLPQMANVRAATAATAVLLAELGKTTKQCVLAQVHKSAAVAVTGRQNARI
jgi:hypothetical protein